MSRFLFVLLTLSIGVIRCSVAVAIGSIRSLDSGSASDRSTLRRSPSDQTSSTGPQLGRLLHINRCNSDAHYVAVYLGMDTVSSTTIPARTTVANRYHIAAAGGVSEKYSWGAHNGLTSSMPVTQIEYTVSGDRISHDISFIDCGPRSSTNKGACPLKDGGILVKHSKAGCPYRYCTPDEYSEVCGSAYTRPEDNAVIGTCIAKNFVHAVDTSIIFCPNEQDLASVGVTDPDADINLLD